MKMSGPSEQDARPIAEEEKVCKANEEILSSAAAEVNAEISSAGHISSSAAAEAEVDKLSLSGNKPFFDVILSKSHVYPPYNLYLPAHAASMLPRAVVHMVFTHGDKEWHATYNGLVKRPAFDHAGWRNFVVGNNLQCEDACIFEVMELSTTIVRLRVIILRNTDCLPPELEADIESVGKTRETAIEID